MGTSTPNYTLEKPTIGGDADTWGDEAPGVGLNENMNIIDTQMKVNEDAAAAAAATADAALPLSGGTMTGALNLDGTVPTAAINAAPKSYVDSEVATAIPLSGSDNITGRLIVTSGAIEIQSSVGDFRLQKTDGSIEVPPLSGDKIKIALKQTSAQFRVEMHQNDNTIISSMQRFKLDETGATSVGFELGNGNLAEVNYTDATDLPTNTSVVTRARGDARYALASGGMQSVAGAVINGSNGSIIRGGGLTAVRNSVGEYTVTLDSALSNANYSVVLTPGTNGTVIVHGMVDAANKTTTTFNVYFYDNANVRVDPTEIYVDVRF